MIRVRPCGPAGLAILVSTLGACNALTFDVDSVRLAAPSASADGGVTPSDASVVEDATDAPQDVGGEEAEVSEVGIDAADSAEMGGPAPQCAVAQPVDPQTCDPTVTEGCPANGQCNLRLGGDFELHVLCNDGEAGTGERGDSCNEVGDCALTFTCFDWSFQAPDPRGRQCAKFCVLETNFGCDDDEFCTSAPAVPEVEGYGWCTPRCDPYDPAACPQGQTCSIDFNYPDSTCSPEFRCVVSEAQPEGSACGPGNDVAACDRGLTCYGLSATEFRCVQPCTDATTCPDGQACAPAAGDWNLRYCQ